LVNGINLESGDLESGDLEPRKWLYRINLESSWVLCVGCVGMCAVVRVCVGAVLGVRAGVGGGGHEFRGCYIIGNSRSLFFEIPIFEVKPSSLKIYTSN